MANAGNRLLTELVLPIDALADGSHRWTNVAGQPDDTAQRNGLIRNIH